MKNILLISFSILFCFLLGEILIRFLYGNPLPVSLPQPEYIRTTYGYKLKPNQRSFIGNKPMRANKHGFRDVDWKIPRLQDQSRIMILGDSMPFGYHVDIEDTFAKNLERHLKEITPQVDVLLAGISGWNPIIELGFLKDEENFYDPDLIILCLFINDYDYNDALPYKTVEIGERVALKPQFTAWLPEEITFLLKKSALVYLSRRMVIPKIFALLNSHNDKEDSRIIEGLMTNTINLNENLAVKKTYSVIKEIKYILDKRGVDFRVLFVPNYELFAYEEGSRHFINHLRSFCFDLGIPFIDPSDNFRQEGNVSSLFLRPWDTSHNSRKGHKVLSARLFLELRPWLEKRIGVESNLSIKD